ncbi:MAG: MOSC domain-containing protein [Cyclobacteriaceae bacterium]
MEEVLIKELLNSIPQKGFVKSIHLRAKKRAFPIQVDQVLADSAKGLEGDHASNRLSKKRQVTLIQFEHLEVIGKILGLDSIDPGKTRRNIVVSGINLFSIRKSQFQIGEAVLEGTGMCDPCSRMEENFGPGAYNAMRGHGGITAKIIKSGLIRQGDRVEFLPQ